MLCQYTPDIKKISCNNNRCRWALYVFYHIVPKGQWINRSTQKSSERSAGLWRFTQLRNEATHPQLDRLEPPPKDSLSRGGAASWHLFFKSAFLPAGRRHVPVRRGEGQPGSCRPPPLARIVALRTASAGIFAFLVYLKRLESHRN